MANQKTRDMSLDLKTLLMKEKFPQLKISRATVYKI